MSKPTEGIWHVITESGSDYLLDLDDLTMQRFPDDEANQLRMDWETVPLIEVVQLEVGHRMELVIDVRGDGVNTYRYTTPVKKLEAYA